jgi:hypothetical protein
MTAGGGESLQCRVIPEPGSLHKDSPGLLSISQLLNDIA